jgi:hypothetical protein
LENSSFQVCFHSVEQIVFMVNFVLILLLFLFLIYLPCKGVLARARNLFYCCLFKSFLGFVYYMVILFFYIF